MTPVNDDNITQMTDIHDIKPDLLEDLKILNDLGVAYGQGYLFAKPAPPYTKIKTFKLL